MSPEQILDEINFPTHKATQPTDEKPLAKRLRNMSYRTIANKTAHPDIPEPNRTRFGEELRRIKGRDPSTPWIAAEALSKN